MIRYPAAAAQSVAPIQARAAEPACLGKEELTAVLMAPPFIERASERCSSFLPAGAFLPTGAAALAARLIREANIPSGRLMTVSTKIAGEAPRQLRDAIMALAPDTGDKTGLSVRRADARG